MRVHLVGNVANNHYVLAKALRQIGVDAHLFYDPRRNSHELPESEDPEVLGGRPEWLHPYVRQKTKVQAFGVLSQNDREQLSKCDLLHVHGAEMTWMTEVGRPYLWHPYGSDLFQLPFYGFWLTQQRVMSFVPDLRGIPFVIAMRRAIRSAAAIVLGWHNDLWMPGLRLLKKLGVEKRIVRHHLAIDAGRFSCKDDRILAEERARRLPRSAEQGVVIFHPTRQAFTSSEISGRKGNDRLYRALGRLHAEGKRFTLIIVEKGVVDENAAKELIRELKMEDRVVWVPAMPRHELIQWYQLSDLTAGDFVNGALGSISLESMSCGTPLMTFMQVKADREMFLDPARLYPEMPPVVNVGSEEEIYRAVKRLLEDPSELRSLGSRSRQWVEQYGSGEAVAHRFRALYEKILSGNGPMGD